MTEKVPVAASELRRTGSVVGQQVLLRIANQTLRFRADSPDVQLFVHDNHVPFLVPPTTAVDCDLTWAIGDVVPSSSPAIRTYEDRWELRSLPDGREEITFFNATPDDASVRPSMQMVADPEFTSVRIRQAPRSGEEPIAYVSEYPWAEYIMQRRLGLHGGAILHASMAIWNGVSHIFLGHSGAGKSTIAELAERVGGLIPTDDRVIVTSGPEGVFGWGSPWHGSFPRTSPAGGEIASISLLVQDAADRVEMIDPRRGIKEMFVRTVQMRLSEREVQTTLDTLERVAGSVPFFELHFRPTTAAVRLVLDAAAAWKRASRSPDTTIAQGLAQRG
jgi:hypothetical protein